MQIQNQEHAEAPTGGLSKKIKNFIFNQKDQIGKGYSSNVYKGFNDVTKEEIAVKVVELSKIKNEVQRYLLNNEMRALRKLHHPHILHCHDILMTKNNIYIVTEFCRGGDLVTLIKQHGRLSEFQALQYLKEMAEGYAFIEENDILHRDLKTANIFLNQGKTKIADFGFCEFVGQARPSIAYNVGSPAYMSPESYRESFYSCKSDVWSLGIIFYEMLVGQVPFKRTEYVELAQNLTAGNLGIPSNVSISQGSRNILVGCFRERVADRLEPKKLLEMVNNEIRRRSQHKINVVSANPLRSSFQVGAPAPLIQNIVTAPQIEGIRQPTTSILGTNLMNLFQGQTVQQLPSIIIPNGPQKPPKNLDISELQAESEVRHENESIRCHTDYIMFLYRLTKLLLESQGTVQLGHHTNHILMILWKDKQSVANEAKPLLSSADSQINREYIYITTRFDDLNVRIDLLEPIEHTFKNILTTLSFRAEQCLKASLFHLKAAIGEADRVVDPQNIASAAILDYLMIYHELLLIQLHGRSIGDVVREASLPELLKDKPKHITMSHIKLLRLKRSLLGI